MLQKKDSILFFTEAGFKVAERIFSNPNETFHIRRLSRDLKVSTTAVISAIERMQKFKVIKVEKNNITSNAKADTDSESYRFYKRIFNLYSLERCRIVEILKEAVRPETIVLFGSFSRGEDTEKSDIDLLIITKNNTHEARQNIASWEQILKRKINIHVLESLKDSSKEFKNAIANGIVLYGYATVV